MRVSPENHTRMNRSPMFSPMMIVATSMLAGSCPAIDVVISKDAGGSIWWKLDGELTVRFAIIFRF